MDYGQNTVSMVNIFAKGAERGVLLMRHSAREFNRDINDLLNPLTDHGRQLSVAMARLLAMRSNCVVQSAGTLYGNSATVA